MASEQEARDAIAACLRSVGERAPARAEYLHGLASRIKQGKLCLVPSDLVVTIAQMAMTTEVVVHTPMFKPTDRVGHRVYGLGTIDHIDQAGFPVVLFDRRRNLPDETRMVTFVGIARDDLWPVNARAEVTEKLRQAESDLARSRNAMDASSFHGRNRTAELERNVTDLRATLSETIANCAETDVRA